MKTNYTHISLVLDRSGSIQSVKSDMEGALNRYKSTNRNRNKN